MCNECGYEHDEENDLMTIKEEDPDVLHDQMKEDG